MYTAMILDTVTGRTDPFDIDTDGSLFDATDIARRKVEEMNDDDGYKNTDRYRVTTVLPVTILGS